MAIRKMTMAIMMGCLLAAVVMMSGTLVRAKTIALLMMTVWLTKIIRSFVMKR